MALSPGGVVVAVIILGLAAVHTAIAAIGLRFFRLQLSTRWGAILYTLVVVPFVYVATTLVVFGVLGVGGTSLALDRGALLVFLWGLPLSLGFSIELFWMPPPDVSELPRRSRRSP